MSAISPTRIGAMVLRYWYLLRSSWPRLLDLVYWPAVQMLMWGFLQLYISQNAGFFARAGGTFIGAVLLWDVLFRGQIGLAIAFFEEVYSRNLGHLFATPLRIACPVGVCIHELADRIQNAEMRVPTATAMHEKVCRAGGTLFQPNSMMPRKVASRKNAASTS